MNSKPRKIFRGFLFSERVADVRFGSLATDAIRARAEQCPLCPESDRQLSQDHKSRSVKSQSPDMDKKRRDSTLQGQLTAASPDRRNRGLSNSEVNVSD
jgi:hypothetical protein